MRAHQALAQVVKFDDSGKLRRVRLEPVLSEAPRIEMLQVGARCRRG